MHDSDKKSLASRTVRNVAWLGSGQAIRQVVALLTMIVLARFLGPAEFGLFAMTVFVTELSQLLVDFGMGSALVQRKELSQRILASCFWVNIGVGLVAAFVLVVTSPLIAAYFGQPLVQWLLLVTAVNILLSSAAVIPQSLLARKLAFRDITIATTVGSLCGAAAALGLATAGMGVWSLALQPVVGTTLATIIMFRKSEWAPSFTFDLSSIRGLLKFSSHLLLSNVLGHVSRNLTSVILGPAMGVAALGKITMAQTITWLPIAQVSQTVVRATFPVFAHLQDDMDRFREGFYKATALIALIAFPLMTGIGVLAGDLVPVVFGPKWFEAAALVSILCVPALIQCVTTLSSTALLAVGRSDLLFRIALFALPLAAVPLWFFRDRPLAFVVGVVAATAVVTSLFSLATALHAIDGSWKRYLAAVFPPAVGSLIMGAAVWILRNAVPNVPPLGRLIGLSLLGAALYCCLTWFLNRRAALAAFSLVRGLSAK